METHKSKAKFAFIMVAVSATAFTLHLTGFLNGYSDVATISGMSLSGAFFVPSLIKGCYHSLKTDPHP